MNIFSSIPITFSLVKPDDLIATDIHPTKSLEQDPTIRVKSMQFKSHSRSHFQFCSFSEISGSIVDLYSEKNIRCTPTKHKRTKTQASFLRCN